MYLDAARDADTKLEILIPRYRYRYFVTDADKHARDADTPLEIHI